LRGYSPQKEWDFSLAEVLLAARMPLALLKIFPIASSVLQHCCFRKFAVRFSAAKSSAILGILKRRRLAEGGFTRPRKEASPPSEPRLPRSAIVTNALGH